MRTPRHLWTGDWRTDSFESRRAEEHRELPRRPVPADGERAEAPPDRIEPPPPEPPRRGPVLRVAASLLLIAGLAAAALAWIADERDDPPDEPARHEALPAEVGKRLEPRAGQTLAGAVFEKTSASVLSVRAGRGSGTAFLAQADGTVVTNSHVVAGADRAVVRFGRDGAPIPARVAGADPSIDVAVLRIEPRRIPAEAKPLRFADSRNVRVGDLAIAIGNPFGLERTATQGIVSATDRDIQAPNGFSIDSVIQTDAPINPGNSGGPLLDDAGLVIGVNSQIATSGTPGNVGIGFAVPSNTVRAAVPALKRGETIRRPYLGVETSLPESPDGEGAEVRTVVAGGPADRAGVRVGDVIRSVDGEAVVDPTDVSSAIARKQVGDVVALRVERDGRSVTLSATLGTRPARIR